MTLSSFETRQLNFAVQHVLASTAESAAPGCCLSLSLTDCGRFWVSFTPHSTAVRRRKTRGKNLDLCKMLLKDFYLMSLKFPCQMHVDSVTKLLLCRHTMHHALSDYQAATSNFVCMGSMPLTLLAFKSNEHTSLKTNNTKFPEIMVLTTSRNSRHQSLLLIEKEPHRRDMPLFASAFPTGCSAACHTKEGRAFGVPVAAISARRRRPGAAPSRFSVSLLSAAFSGAALPLLPLLRRRLSSAFSAGGLSLQAVIHPTTLLQSLCSVNCRSFWCRTPSLCN